MNRSFRVALTAAVSCVALPSLVTGCSSADPGPSVAEREEAAIATKNAALDADFRRQLSSAIAIAEACRTDRTEECAMRALERASGNAPAGAGVQPRDWWNWEAAKDRAEQALALTHEAICDSLRWTQGHVRVYYMIGASGQAGVGVYGIAGAERVWDLTLHQGLAYVYAGGGVGNVGGFSASVYEGFAVAGRGGGLLDNWSGCFIGDSVSLAIPETQIGGGLSGFRGCSTNPAAVQGVAWHGDAGLNAFNPAVSVTAQGTYYIPFDLETEAMHWFTDDVHGNKSERFLDFKGVSTPWGSLTAGYAQAVHILWYGGGAPGSIGAAAAAIGLDSFRANASWCARRTAQVGCGNGGGDLSTAACAGGGELGDDSPTDPGSMGPPGQPPPPPPSDAVSCAVDDHCDAGDVCSPNGPDAFCCRPPFTASSPMPCDPGLGGCGPGMICAAGAMSDDPALTFTCVDPKAHPCSATNP